MSVWELYFDTDAFRPILPVDDKDWRVLRHLDLIDWQSQLWKSIAVKIAENGEHDENGIAYPERVIGDFFTLPAYLPVLTDRTRAILHPLIDEQVDLFPLECPSMKLWIANPKVTVDCYNEALSSFQKLAPHVYMGVEWLIFEEGCLEGLDIFKIPPFGTSMVIVSERFKQLVEANNLTGVEFRKVSE